MKFSEAFAEMAKGKKIARPAFRNIYWFIDSASGKFMIHLANGKNISYGQLDLTVKNCLAEDWYVLEVTEEKEEK